MATCLVTGATGFVGGHLVELLVSRGDQVRCQVRERSDTSRIAKLGAELRVCDLVGEGDLDDLVKDVEIVYHVAGVIHAVNYKHQMRVNRDGVERVVEACARQTHPPRFLLVSSVAASGPVSRGALRRESDPPEPVSVYGKTKLAGERAARKWADRVPVTIVRPGIVFGPHDRGLLPLFRAISRSRIHFIPSLHAPPLSLIHATDLASLVVRCAESGKRVSAGAGEGDQSGEGTYFACVPEYPTYAELGKMIARAVGREKVFNWYMPGLAPWIVAGVNECWARLRRRSTPLRIDKIREARAPSWACSCERAQRELGFVPAKPLTMRLAETVHWYREAGWI